MMLQKRSTIIKNLKNHIIEKIKKCLLDLDYPLKNFSLVSPKQKKFGDLSTNIAMLLANEIKKEPVDIADKIKNNLIKKRLDNIETITVTDPGFINFKIDKSFYQKKLKSIISKGDSFGKDYLGKNKTANVEFVSANPTGPLTVGHGRNAILGDTVSNILEWHGYTVTREYYYNDAGKQMRILGQSVFSRYLELLGKSVEFPEDGYQGDYIIEIAKFIKNKFGDKLNKDDPIFLSIAEEKIFNQIKTSLKTLGINFDIYSNEKSYYENGAINRLLKKLKEKKLIYEKDGATWFKASSIGRKQDKVYIKNSGEPTYRLPDTVYHLDKIKRKYDFIVDVFGADHSDTYPDVLSALNSLGHKTDHIKVLLYQFVTIIKNGEKIKMSTRKGDFITLDDLMKELNPDIIRYFFIMRSMNSHLDFDIDLAKDQSEKNPVFYLQYAYARICNIISHGSDKGYELSDKFETKLLIEPSEIKLMKHLANFPEVMNSVLDTLEPQNLINYLQNLAANFHKFYGSCKVITENKNLTQARLVIVNSVKIVLSSGLDILGISAPEKM